MMGGPMWAESEPGKGSTFLFTALLPSAPRSSGPSSINRRATGVIKTLSVLVVDDNATNRKILEAQLRSWRMLATIVSLPAEALEKLAEHFYDLALIDYQMPGMDGVDTRQKNPRADRHAVDPALLVGRNHHRARCRPSSRRSC